jgi:L-methionine (R)-S-oxide reductase
MVRPRYDAHMIGPSRDPVIPEVEQLLRQRPQPLDSILAAVCARFGCALGTLHVFDATGVMQLRAERNLPAVVRDKVRTIPIGKGMAGIAAQRRQPVQVCNLQTDTSGVARPDAKLTKMEGSIACPLLDGDRLVGVIGVAKPVPYDFTAAETALLLAVGAVLARGLA